MPRKTSRDIIKRNPLVDKRKTPKGNNYLFTIGIDDYQHCQKLYNAVRDANDFTQILFDRYKFEPKQYFKLENQEATKDNIIETFRTIKNQLSPHDNLIIYYSGHGELDLDFDESYWVTVESRKGKIGDYLSLESLVKYIRAIKTHHTVLIVDACFAGAILVNRRSGAKALERDPSRYVLASGRKEFADDGEPGENSPFAMALIEKLKSNQESLLITDLAQYVKKQTMKATNNTQRPIYNPLQIEEDKGGEFVFHLKNQEGNDWNISIQIGTIDALERFLETYPNGKYAKKAIAKITLLKQIEKQKLKDLKKEPNVNANIFTDDRDGQLYKTIKLKDGKIWLAQNLNFKTQKNSWLYGGDHKKGTQYGRLYTWESALKACPPGWHLPTDEEWWEMIAAYGKAYNKLNGHDFNTNDGAGERAFQQLITEGKSQFEASLGGSRNHDGSFRHLEDWGYYWSATEKNELEALYYYFDAPRKRASRYRNDKRLGFSCRCVKNG